MIMFGINMGLVQHLSVFLKNGYMPILRGDHRDGLNEPMMGSWKLINGEQWENSRVKNKYAATARILYIEPMLHTIAKVRTMANGG